MKIWKRFVLVMGLVAAGLLILPGCAANLEEEEVALPLKNSKPMIPLQVEFRGNVSLEGGISDTLNLGLAVKGGAHFVYQDTVFTNLDPEAQTIEYRFEELPVLRGKTKLFLGLYKSTDLHGGILLSYLDLFFIRNSFVVSEARVRILDSNGEVRTEPLLIGIDPQAISIPGNSVATIEIVFQRPESMAIQGMTLPCYDLYQRWYKVYGWQADVQYSRDICVVQESSKRCLSAGNWVAISRLAEGKGRYQAPGAPGEITEEAETRAKPFGLFQDALVDYSGLNVRGEADVFCTRWIR